MLSDHNSGTGGTRIDGLMHRVPQPGHLKMILAPRVSTLGVVMIYTVKMYWVRAGMVLVRGVLQSKLYEV